MKTIKIKNTLLCLSAIFVATVAWSAEMQHHFNSPAFTGIGWSSHVLTVYQLETQAKEKNQAKADAEKAKAEADALNTPQARFISNLESRVYSQLAKQLTDSMFGDGATCKTAGIVCGNIPDLGGNKIEWMLGAGSDKGMIIISIVNNSNPSQVTTMKVPAGTFAF
jgi:hypothetical protein